MKKLRKAAVILLTAYVLIAGSILYLMNCPAKFMPFTSEYFTDEEITEAMNMAYEEAENTLGEIGCNILKVEYEGDKYIGNNTIYIRTPFFTGFAEMGNIEPLRFDHGWHYEFKKNQDGEWEIIGRGHL